MAGEDGTIRCNNHRLLLAVNAQALPQDRQLVLGVAAVVAGVRPQVIDSPPFYRQCCVHAHLIGRSGRMGILALGTRCDLLV